MTKALAVLGSASDVGKSLVAAGLCRLLADEGFDVAPFKAQNMANQAGVTDDGLEMPRAQILQAHACRQIPHVDMGSVLLKPMSQTGAQVVVMGRAVGTQEASEYFKDTSCLAGISENALLRLAAKHDLIVIEGAGSPVELNLMDRDFVNLRPARRLNAALILVVDIDKGGVFAQAKGTLDLLPEKDRARVIGLVVNRFRGDSNLFEDGIHILESICGVPVLALVPHVDHALDEEDRPFRIPVDEAPVTGMLNVGAVLYPRVSNTEDLAPLLAEPDVHLTWITKPELALGQDLLVLPGSKATVGDLAHLAAIGMTEAILTAHKRGIWVLGLCGGYQMLGQKLEDPERGEGGPQCWNGIGLLEASTRFEPCKITHQSEFRSLWPEAGHLLTGYEIHHGRTHQNGRGDPLVKETGAEAGWRGTRVLGSYLHGLLANDPWRSAFLNEVRRERGFANQPVHSCNPLELRIQRWAKHLKHSLRPRAWERILNVFQNGSPAP